MLSQFHVSGFCLNEIPKGTLIVGILNRLQLRRYGKPFIAFQVSQVSLGDQEVRVEHVSKLVCKQAGDQVVSICTTANFGDHGIATVDQNGDIVGAGYIGVIRLPI